MLVMLGAACKVKVAVGATVSRVTVLAVSNTFGLLSLSVTMLAGRLRAIAPSTQLVKATL